MNKGIAAQLPSPGEKSLNDSPGRISCLKVKDVIVNVLEMTANPGGETGISLLNYGITMNPISYGYKKKLLLFFYRGVACNYAYPALGEMEVYYLNKCTIPELLILNRVFFPCRT